MSGYHYYSTLFTKQSLLGILIKVRQPMLFVHVAILKTKFMIENSPNNVYRHCDHDNVMLSIQVCLVVFKCSKKSICSC